MRIVIIGAGIAGLSSAWALTKAGHAVVLIDQGPIPNPLSASGDQHRLIRRAYGAADGYARTIGEAFEAWEELWRDLGTRHYAECGVLAISQKEGDGAEEFRLGLDRNGDPYRLFEPADAQRRYPFLDAATFRYAYLSEEGGALFCRRIASGLVAWLRTRGAEVRPMTCAASVNHHAGAVRLDNGETLHADRIVVTAGAWTLRLFPDLAEDLALYRTAVAYLEPPAALRSAWQSAPAILDIGGAADGYVLPPVSGTGLKIGAGVHRRPSPDPDRRRTPEPGEGERLRALFSPPIANIEDYALTDVVTCAYAFTPDHRFFSRHMERAWIISACSGHGYKFGAAVGRRVAQAIDEDAPEALRLWLRAEQHAGGVR